MAALDNLSPRLETEKLQHNSSMDTMFVQHVFLCGLCAYRFLTLQLIAAVAREQNVV